MSVKTVETDVANGVARVTLSREELLNAIDPATVEALASVLEALATDESIRVVILTGAGRGFCAGGDIKAMAAALGGGSDLQSLFGSVLDGLARVILALRGMPKPTIGAVNGVASGAGVSLAAACDLRFAAASATFKGAYATIGLTPDAGWSLLVPSLIGWARAMEMLLLDEAFDASRALDLGLVHEVVKDDELRHRVDEVARRLAALAPGAVAGGKELVNRAVMPELARQLDSERQRILQQLPELEERLGRFLQGRR